MNVIKKVIKYINILKRKYKTFYVLKLDISKYFYSIDHNILKELLKDKLNEEEYKIVSSIIDSTNESYINNIIINIKNNLLIKDKNRCNEINKLPLYKYNKGLCFFCINTFPDKSSDSRSEERSYDKQP